jgi:hypothetical protein
VMLAMLNPGNPMVWVTGIVALGVVLFTLRGHFTTEARARRRRDKSHRPVISRKKGPTVRLAVNVDEPESGRDR